uniref:Mur ligase domain-containing protein n=1 Tax=Bacteroides fragilis TaxID=817 RepID=UPI000ABADBAE
MDGDYGGSAFISYVIVRINQYGSESQFGTVAIQESAYVNRVFPEEGCLWGCGCCCCRIISLWTPGTDILIGFSPVFSDTALYQIFLDCAVVTTDSRNCPAGSLFIALKGESFNGNAFAAQALKDGCAYAIVD